MGNIIVKKSGYDNRYLAIVSCGGIYKNNDDILCKILGEIYKCPIITNDQMNKNGDHNKKNYYNAIASIRILFGQ